MADPSAQSAIWPTITIAIACYNQGHYLPDAIDSILAQTRPADAIILVDDGSDDDTPAIAARHPALLYYRQANAGLSAARNAGLAFATTSHILFLDADDLLHPTVVERALAAVVARPDIAFAYGGYRDVTAERRPIGEHAATSHADAFLAMLHDNFIGMHGTVLYDTATLRAVGGFDTSLASCEDWDVYLKLTRHYPIAAYPGIGADYRRHRAGMSVNTGRMIAMMRKVIGRQIAVGLSPAQRKRARQGVVFNTRHYSLQLIAELRRSPGSRLPKLWLGIRSDPLFPWRIAGAGIRAVGRRLRKR